MRKAILVLMVALGIVSWMGMSCHPAFGRELSTEDPRSIGITLLKGGQGYYLGLLGRGVISVARAAATLIELGMANGVTGDASDNDLEFVEGSLIFYFPAAGLSSYLGVGTGFYRHAERPGGAVWTHYRFYTLLVGGVEFVSELGEPFFYVEGKATTEEFNPIISIGWYFPIK